MMQVEGRFFQVGIKPHLTKPTLLPRSAREIREILGQYAEKFGDLGRRGVWVAGFPMIGTVG